MKATEIYKLFQDEFGFKTEREGNAIGIISKEFTRLEPFASYVEEERKNLRYYKIQRK